MKLPWTIVLASMLFAFEAMQAATISYTYDAQHRLVQANYSASEKVFYSYDAAGNVDMHITITDGQYLKSFLWYLSSVPDSIWMLRDVAGLSWPEIWAGVSAKS